MNFHPTIRVAVACVFGGLIGVSLGVADEPASAPDSMDTREALLAPYREEALAKWDTAIRAMERQNGGETHGEDSLLILGSSSIRLWESAAVDLAPYRIIRRGYGGAKFSDVAVFAERLMHPHAYRGMVIFVGNDISGSETDHTAEEVEPLVRHILSVSHQHQPGAPVFLMEVTPTPSRFTVWPEIRRFNAMLREVALSTADTHFVATAGQVLDPAGNPRRELFREDALHLSEAGYRLWSAILFRRLNEVFQLMAKTSSRH